MEAKAKNLVRGLIVATLVCGASSMAAATEKDRAHLSGVVHPPLEPSKGQARAETIVDGLQNPWAMAFLPDDGGILITERPGRLRVWRNGELAAPVDGIPEVYARSQGGLLDVVLAPDFDESRRIYLAYAEQDDRGRAGTAVGFGNLSADYSRLENFEVIFRQEPKLSSGAHFGVRLVFDEDGYLFIALGENNQRATSQDLDKHQGKIVRLHADGSVPKDNPFVDQPDAKPEIWSYGHRNQQGAAINPWTGELWTHEHGARGGDEINIPRPGLNYGWPLATHGRNYSGLPIPEAKGVAVEGTEPPHYVWLDSPAISGMAFYDSERFPEWRNSLFIGALKHRELIRLQLDGDKVVAEERLLGDLGLRIRDVRLGPNGYIYALTDEKNGSLLRVSPGSRPRSLPRLMRLLLVSSFATLAACQSAVPFEPVTDQCNSLQYLSLVGTKVDEIKPGQFPEGTRYMETLPSTTGSDYQADRLNVVSNNAGRITHIECG